MYARAKRPGLLQVEKILQVAEKGKKDAAIQER